MSYMVEKWCHAYFLQVKIPEFADIAKSISAYSCRSRLKKRQIYCGSRTEIYFIFLQGGIYYAVFQKSSSIRGIAEWMLRLQEGD
jgi:hypothetical protein